MSERRSPERGSIGPNKGDLGPGDIEWVVTPQEAARGAAGRQAESGWGDPSPLDESRREPEGEPT